MKTGGAYKYANSVFSVLEPYVLLGCCVAEVRESPRCTQGSWRGTLSISQVSSFCIDLETLCPLGSPPRWLTQNLRRANAFFHPTGPSPLHLHHPLLCTPTFPPLDLARQLHGVVQRVALRVGGERTRMIILAEDDYTDCSIQLALAGLY